MFWLFFAPNWQAISAELETNDIPPTLAGLDKWYVEPPTNQNGALYFQQAAEILSRDLEHNYYTNESGRIVTNVLFPFAEELVTNGPLSHAAEKAMVPLMERVKLAWPMLERGAKCEQSRYPINLTEGWGMQLPELSEVHADVWACELLALNQADARKGKPAADDILMILAAIHSLEAEPLLVSQSVRGGCLTLAVRRLEQTINRVCLPIDSLDQLQNAFDDVEQRETEGKSFLRGLAGERLVWGSYFDASSNQLAEVASYLLDTFWISNYTKAQIPELIAKGWKSASTDRKLLDEMCVHILALWNEGYPRRFDIDEIFSSGMADLGKRQLGFIQLTEDSGNIVKREGSVIANLRLARTAVALERYRAGHENRYPESLAALAPTYLSVIPRDIFADAPLKYERHGNGYLLYSVGSDQKDDGGSSKTDIIFRAINPPGRAIIE